MEPIAKTLAPSKLIEYVEFKAILKDGKTIELIQVFKAEDQALLQNAPGVVVTKCTLPSGYKIPDGKEGKEWVVIQPSCIALQKKK